MRRRAPRPRLEIGPAGDGPADTATVVIGIDGSSASWAAFASAPLFKAARDSCMAVSLPPFSTRL